MMLFHLDQPEQWPTELTDYLNRNHSLFLGWERRQVKTQSYDKAIYGLIAHIASLDSYVIRGWHCTRLTETEIILIVEEGMKLPCAEMLSRRIDALVNAHQIHVDIAQVLKLKNQSNDRNRAGVIWFCFYPPRQAGEPGINRFFRHWGGEALYNSHEKDPVISAVLRSIGTPCVIEADVPITFFAKSVELSLKIVQTFLVSRGFKTHEPSEHEDRINRPLSKNNIRRVIRFPDPDFLSLTGCKNWEQRITEERKS